MFQDHDSKSGEGEKEKASGAKEGCLFVCGHPVISARADRSDGIWGILGPVPN